MTGGPGEVPLQGARAMLSCTDVSGVPFGSTSLFSCTSDFSLSKGMWDLSFPHLGEWCRKFFNSISLCVSSEVCLEHRQDQAVL